MNWLTGVELAAPMDVPRQQPLTHLAERLGWTAVFAAFVTLSLWVAWRGWRRRSAAQSRDWPLPAVPEHAAEPVSQIEGTYLCTMWRPGDSAGSAHGRGSDLRVLDHSALRRVAASRLAFPSAATMSVLAEGVLVRRQEGPDVFVPATSLREVVLDSGIGGRYVARDGVLLLLWHPPVGASDPVEFVTGFRVRHTDEVAGAVRALRGLATAQPATRVSG